MSSQPNGTDAPGRIPLASLALEETAGLTVSALSSPVDPSHIDICPGENCSLSFVIGLPSIYIRLCRGRCDSNRPGKTSVAAKRSYCLGHSVVPVPELFARLGTVIFGLGTVMV